VKQFLIILALLLLPLAQGHATDQAYLRDPTQGNYCQIVGASGSPVTITCNAAHGYSVGQIVIIYNVLGNVIVNGIRKVATVPTATTFTITDINNVAVNTSSAYVAPNSIISTCVQAYCYGGASPGKLYTLSTHPRGWLDGSSGTLTTALSNTSGRANPSGIQYTALAFNQTNTGSSYPSETFCPNTNDCANFTNAALKWWVDGQPTGAEQTYAQWLILHPTIYWLTMVCDQTQAWCGPTLNAGQALEFSTLYAPAQMMNYELIYSSLTSGQRQTFANFMLNDNAEASDGLGLTGAIDTSCTPLTTDPWTDGHNYCGSMWIYKHSEDGPLSDPAYYPTNGGSDLVDIGNNGGWSKAYAYFLTGISLCGSDGGDPVADRGCRLASEADAFMWDHLFADAAGNWGGRLFSTDVYNGDRVGYMYENYLNTLQNSAVSFPTVTSNSIPADQVYSFIYDSLPYNPGTGVHWGDSGGYGQTFDSVGGYRSLTSAMHSNSTAAPYGFYFMQTTANWWNSGNVIINSEMNYLPWYYVWLDPTVTPTNPNTFTTQYLNTPRNSSFCTSNNVNCSLYALPVQSVVSKTGWGTTDTLVDIEGIGNTGDGHTSFANHCEGCIRIYRNQATVGGDNSQAPNGIGEDDDVIEVGGSPNYFFGNGLCQNPTSNSNPTIDRWASTNPTGDSSSRYMYARMNLVSIYCPVAGITQATKEIIHFKKSGSQDYVVVYFEGEASGATDWREFVHYRLKQDESATTYSPGITLSRVSRTVNLEDTATSSEVNTKFLQIAGNIYVNDYYTSDTNCLYSGSTGASCRVEVGTGDGTSPGNLAAATVAEWAYVHQPCNGTSCTMPTITQPTCSGTGGNCAAVQIADSGGPKMAVFARQGATLTAVSCTSTASGTIQYLVAGITPGTYAVTIGGSPVSGSPFTVNANDDTIYFEGAAGAMQVGASSSPPPGVAPQLLMQ
jgi:hypothetical protein